MGKWDINDTSHGVFDFFIVCLAWKVVFISKREVLPFVILESYVTILKSIFINAFRFEPEPLKCVIDRHQIQQIL
jgi:hypothetical protein